MFTASKAELIKREVVALRVLVGCRNVVQWMEDISYDVSRDEIHLHMEYYPHGTLETLINPQNGFVPKDTVIQIFCCMSMALEDCHGRGIIHRDIKPANSTSTSFRESRSMGVQLIRIAISVVLLSKKMWEGQVVTVAYLADFGIGKLYSPTWMAGGGAGTMGMGTPLYMAPVCRSPVYLLELPPIVANIVSPSSRNRSPPVHTTGPSPISSRSAASCTSCATSNERTMAGPGHTCL